MRSRRSKELAVLFPLLVAACGGSTSTDGAAKEETKSQPNTAYPLLLACKVSSQTRWDAVTPNEKWDGFEIRRFDWSYNGGPDSGVAFRKTFRALCTKASDPAACEAKVAIATDGTGWPSDPYGQVRAPPEFAVATIGDEVHTFKPLDEVAAAVAPIESPQEAAVFAYLRELYTPHCLSEDEPSRDEITLGGMPSRETAERMLGALRSLEPLHDDVIGQRA
jgi:hypothetical protein